MKWLNNILLLHYIPHCIPLPKSNEQSTVARADLIELIDYLLWFHSRLLLLSFVQLDDELDHASHIFTNETIIYFPYRFFKQFLIFFIIQQMAAGLLRLVAGITRHMTTANTYGCIFSLLLMSLAGFAIPKGSHLSLSNLICMAALMPKWCRLGYWISPLTYAFNAVAINEMLSPRWMDKFAPDGRRLGLAILENINAFTDKSWYWKSAGVLLGYAIFFNILFTLSLQYLNPLSKPNPLLSEDPEVEVKDQKHVAVDNGNLLEMKERSWSNDSSIASPDWRSCETYKNKASKTGSVGGMALPFTPLAMSFKEVNYYVNIPPVIKKQGVTEDRLQLLRGVTGVFRPGILTALMGESGAGKTTLMDVLAGRKTAGHIEGDIRIAGYPKKQSTFARISGYCEQFDVHSPQLTVEESLIFSALLRLPNEVTEEDKLIRRVVMELVELKVLKDALVGIPGVTGLSTEQRKRLTIAVELVANPSIVFMDEPTSGLDARAAAIVMRTVRNTVNTGRTVVCTIHQPSIDIFESFDELLLLKRGGQLIYSGPLGPDSQKLIGYFESVPGVHKIKNGRNPAAWMLEESSIASEARLGINFAEIYKSSALHKRNMALVKELSKPFPGTTDLHFSTQYPQSSFDQFKICLWKYWSIYWRNPEYNLSRLGYTLVTAILLGSIFWKIGLRRDSSTDLNSVIGAMYLAVLFLGLGTAPPCKPLLQMRELYITVIIEIPYVIFQTVYYVIIIYSMMSFQWTTLKFLWFFVISFLTFIYFTYFGMLSVAVSPNSQVAGILSAFFFFLFNLFSGFFIPGPELPVWWVWYYRICPVSWTFYGLIVTQYSDMYDLIKVPGQSDQQIRDYVMHHFGYRDDQKNIMLLVLLGFTLVFAAIYTYCIRSINFQRRTKQLCLVAHLCSHAQLLYFSFNIHIKIYIFFSFYSFNILFIIVASSKFYINKDIVTILLLGILKEMYMRKGTCVNCLLKLLLSPLHLRDRIHFSPLCLVSAEGREQAREKRRGDGSLAEAVAGGFSGGGLRRNRRGRLGIVKLILVFETIFLRKIFRVCSKLKGFSKFKIRVSSICCFLQNLFTIMISLMIRNKNIWEGVSHRKKAILLNNFEVPKLGHFPKINFFEKVFLNDVVHHSRNKYMEKILGFYETFYFPKLL
ncbi:hypothetical protein IEQ34_007366 [Dendrobium chrysotoxum]|uniref:ABC transporter domain-containing protein n=1 Tax=Dendrobium chrysotoxum TaxID=161865 RepID=A0AAV7GRV7_DENCH|nr:hypothetical protein IEQ34_007366 [Dendrobium chrysotoxum]